MKSTILGLAALTLGAWSLQAAAQTSGLNHIDAYYIPSAEIDRGFSDNDGDGFGFKGRAQFADQLFFTGEYQAVEYDDSNAELDQLRAGAGLFSPINRDVNLIGRAEYIRADFDTPGSDAENGFGIHGGAEAALTPQFLVHGSVGYVDVGDLGSGAEFLVGLRFLATDVISIFADYRISRLSDSGSDLDLDDLRIGAGFHF